MLATRTHRHATAQVCKSLHTAACSRETTHKSEHSAARAQARVRSAWAGQPPQIASGSRHHASGDWCPIAYHSRHGMWRSCARSCGASTRAARSCACIILVPHRVPRAAPCACRVPRAATERAAGHEEHTPSRGCFVKPGMLRQACGCLIKPVDASRGLWMPRQA